MVAKCEGDVGPKSLESKCEGNVGSKYVGNLGSKCEGNLGSKCEGNAPVFLLRNNHNRPSYGLLPIMYSNQMHYFRKDEKITSAC